ncbi:MAG: ABC transporter substrate-binding protein [Candidatus Rokuibacteriota bacterium]|nr:MAG: ABC transporter substrate-binding protein [Candidatus Rokubacteria bacterium]
MDDMRLFARGIAALALAACALGGAGEVPGQGAKVRLGVLKLTSSAVLFLGAEKGYFREFGVEPELVFFDAAQPIAVAIASGDLDVGATGLTAGLYNIVAGGVKIWIVADKGREWPDHNLTALLVRRDLYDAGARTLRDLKGRTIGVTQIGSTFHYNVGRLLEREGMAPGDVEIVPLQSLGAVADALQAKRLDAAATAEPFVSRLESSGAGVTIIRTGDSLPWQIAAMLYSDTFARDRRRAVAFMRGYVKSSRHYFDAVLRKKSGPEFDEVVAITATYTGARPELIRRGFPYQDRDGRLMPGDIGRQTAWWYARGLVKAPIAATGIVDESFLREALEGLK